MMILITNGQIAAEKGILNNHELLIKEDKIEKIAPKGKISIDERVQVVDAQNGIVSPGFVDIHADYIEQMAAPRPTSLMDFNLSIRETEKVLINNGITTMFHSLSLYKSDEFSYNPIRSAENVKKFIEVIDKSHNSRHLIRHRFHARLEIDNFEEIENLKGYIKENKVHLISFMDHSPGQGQYRNIETYKKIIKGYKNVTDEQLDETIQKNHTKEKMTIAVLKEIADLAGEKNIAVASHDDDCIEKLEIAKSFGIKISEFPITLEVAQKACEAGMYTIAGAPNVLLGGSHSNNLCAAEAVKQNTIDILCSDYYPAAMLHAVFILHEKYGQDLGKMINLVSINPARAVKMDHMIGSIEEGKKADIIIIEKIEDNFPVITSAFVDGKLISKTNYRI